MPFSPNAFIFPILLVLSLQGAGFSQTETPDSKPAKADIIYFRNGQEIEGRITSENETHVTIEFRGGEIVLPRRRIERIVLGPRVEAAEKQQSSDIGTELPSRDEMYFIYYRGKCVGWRQSTLQSVVASGKRQHQFHSRTVFRDADGNVDLDVQVSESIDAALQPLRASVVQSGPDFSSSSVGDIRDGHMKLRRSPDKSPGVEILFGEDVELTGPLMRTLADRTHFPSKGETYRSYDILTGEFRRLHATRTLRSEIVAGRHQLVTVWKLRNGTREWEMWVDTRGGIVREELGGAHMVALRAPAEAVLAWSRGEASQPSHPDLKLAYENEMRGFELARPNLSWSFEFPEADSPHAITLVEPALQATVDVVVLDDQKGGVAAEGVVLDLLGRWERSAEDVLVEFQEPRPVGELKGIRVSATMRRKGVRIRTHADVCRSETRAYIILSSAPTSRFHEAEDAFSRIRRSLRFTEKIASVID